MVESILLIFDSFIVWVVLLFLNLPVVFEFLRLFLRSNVPAEKSPRRPLPFYSFVITSYQNMEICKKLLDSIFRIDYDRFEVILIADMEEIQLSLTDDRLKVYRPPRPLSSKIKSLQHSSTLIASESQGIIVLDPDNLVHPQFIQHMNELFLQPYQVVQGQRRAKNLNNTVARIDALGEIYHNYTDRELTFSIGSSASIAGSGMCIEKSLFIEFLESDFLSNHMKSRYILGEDKLLQNYIIRNRQLIAYGKKSIVYDEKVLTNKQMTRQRARWINTYFNNSLDALRLIAPGLLKGDWNAVIFGLTTGKPPLFLTISLCLVMLVIHLLLWPQIALVIGLGLLVFTIHFLYVAGKKQAFRLFWRVTYALPSFIFHQLKALIRARKLRNEFGNTTPSQHLSIDEVMQKDHQQ